MADDLLLNFADTSTTERPLKRRKLQASSNSGPWRKRLERQRLATQKDNVHSRPAPRAVETVPRTPLEPASLLRTTQSTTPSGQRKPTAARKAIISSLFSSRPALPDAPAYEEPAQPAAPSNAPAHGSFGATGLQPELIEHLTSAKMGYERPTPIQASALPLLLDPKHGEDVILQAQTGSGKTLAYLMPIIQDLLSFGARRKKLGRSLDRSVGTLAIILAPTRELANQIHDAAQSMLSFRLPDGSSPRWITPGLLSGGMHRQHEKARLRKGLPLVIATPGRLVDHMTSTSSFRLAGDPRPKRQGHGGKPENGFDVEDNPVADPEGEDSEDDDLLRSTSRSWRPRSHSEPDPELSLRWLVLDEADRLVDMGFEPQVREILDNLAKRKRSHQKPRRTLLCSATMPEGVEKLAGVALRTPRTITPALLTAPDHQHERPAPPDQLTQTYTVVAPKLRFVALIALLRRLLSGSTSAKTSPAADGGNKALVFVSCTAAVDLLWSALGGLHMGASDGSAPGVEAEEDEEEDVGLVQRSAVLPGASIYRLHGQLELTNRLAALKAFSLATDDAILICTSVAARGLDVPFVRTVVQYDLPTEGGVNEYVHRVGRTARAGRAGEAWTFLLPSEAGWIPWAEERMTSASIKAVSLRNTSQDSLLEAGFGGAQYETRATDVQMAYERWVERSSEHASLARTAFLSHVRAYATHPSDEKHLFHVRHLHLGHLAKSFGLREAPKEIMAAFSKQGRRKERMESDEEMAGTQKKQPRTGRGREGKGLRPARTDASEFAVAGADEIERMLSGGRVKKARRV